MLIGAVITLIVLNCCLYLCLQRRELGTRPATGLLNAFQRAHILQTSMILYEVEHLQRLLHCHSHVESDWARRDVERRIIERRLFAQECLAAYAVITGLWREVWKNPHQLKAYRFPFCHENYDGRADDFPPQRTKLKGVPALVCYHMEQTGFTMSWKRCWFSDDVTVVFTIKEQA